MITIEALDAARGRTPVLSDVSLSIAAGETVGVMGANGTGKTTLLKLIAGLREADAGNLEVDGTVGFAPEDPQAGLFADTVAEEVAFYPRNRGLEVDRHRDAAMDALEVDSLRDRDPYSLSVGEQRRVSIAAVVAGDPDVLVLDEPTRGLDAARERHLGDCLGALNVTLVFSTHAADFGYAVADRVAVLADGGLRRVDEARAVLADEPFLESVGVRPPGIVSWARRHGLDPPPADLAEAVARLEATP